MSLPSTNSLGNNIKLFQIDLINPSLMHEFWRQPNDAIKLYFQEKYRLISDLRHLSYCFCLLLSNVICFIEIGTRTLEA